MNKKIIAPTILFIIVAVFAIVALLNKRPSDVPVATVENTENQSAVVSDGIILFYGDGCPHCAIVEEYVNQNGVEAKVSFAKKEVYYNKHNADELVAKARACGMPTDSIGVPFLWDGSKCLVGDQDIIEFFKTKTNGQ
ncbi:MAG: hypothetical protein PHO91_00960 [Patescibacteria group bacterium]|nr:hypothetical protein [Patescibacteria group bacterium]